MFFLDPAGLYLKDLGTHKKFYYWNLHFFIYMVERDQITIFLLGPERF